ncbi:MAG: hypothetical protein J6X11_01540 [Treponema sp.]|nr:hypothetical protein [Treponema sp.]
MENQLKLKIKIGQVEFEAEGEAKAVTEQRDVFIQSIVPAATSFLDKIQNIETTNMVESSTNQKFLQKGNLVSYMPISDDTIDLSRTSLVTYLQQFGELSDQNFILFSAYYYENTKQEKPYVFNVENVKDFYSTARRAPYSNNSELLKKLAQKGFIMDAPGSEQKNPKQYILSSDGIEYINEYTPIEKSEKKPVKKLKQRKKNESVYNTLNSDDLNLSKYPSVKDLDSPKKQIIMTMYIVTNENKGEWFLATDIEFILINVLNIHITLKQIQNLFDRNKNLFAKRQSESNKKAFEYRLLSGASDFAMKIIDDPTSK